MFFQLIQNRVIQFLLVTLAVVIILVPKGQGGMVPSGAIQDIQSILGDVRVVEVDSPEAALNLPPPGPKCFDSGFLAVQMLGMLQPGAQFVSQAGDVFVTVVQDTVIVAERFGRDNYALYEMSKGTYEAAMGTEPNKTAIWRTQELVRKTDGVTKTYNQSANAVQAKTGWDGSGCPK